MKKIFSGLMGSLSKGSTDSNHKIAMITNSSACILGKHLLIGLSQRGKVINFDRNPDDFSLYDPSLKGQGKIDNIIPFQGFANEETDRVRLIAFLKQENFIINRLIHNQPFMIKPSEKEVNENT